MPDTEGISKIEGLLRHDDLEYIKQGWLLLFSVVVEQVCRYVKMEDGQCQFCGDFGKRDWLRGDYWIGYLNLKS